MKKTLTKFEETYLPEFVFGGIDGTVTSFAIITGVIGAALSSQVILILGLANLFASGFSMGVSNYLSYKSKNDVLTKHHHEVAKSRSPVRLGFVMFCAFTIIGAIPLLPFIVASFVPMSASAQFGYSILITEAAFVCIGLVKGRITGKSSALSALQTFIIGTCAALIAYGVGLLISRLV